MTEEEIAYKMPKVGIGMAVLIYPYGRDDGDPHYAIVRRCDDRSIIAQPPGSQPRGGIRHISDPVLKNRDDEFRKDCGAWDFTEEKRRVDDMEERLAVLESLMAPTQLKKK